MGILPSQIAEVGYPKSPPWCTPTRACLPIGGKKNISNEVMKSEFLKHASEHQGQSVFTDGSKSSEGVGCAVMTGDTVIRRKLPSSCSIFTAEAFAILLAVKHVFNKGNFKETFTIFTYSLSVLFTLKQLLPSHHMVQEIHFCWVPAHVGVIGNERADKAAKEALRMLYPSPVGNERADQAAKEALRMLYPSPVSIPYRGFRSAIHFYVKDRWQSSWSSLTDNLKLRSIHPSIEKWQSLGISDRRASILLTRMCIGHTHVTHSYLMKSGEERDGLHFAIPVMWA